ncbi:MAG: PQQ-binding-like beta-propeller repeat protein [Phycisphaerae bacterium]
MSRLSILAVMALCVCPLPAADPAAPTVVGWRGDGSGIFPKADPPIHWERVSKAVAGLRYQTAPPKGDEPSGAPMPDGVIREWLVLGPVDAQKGEKNSLTDALLAEDQSKLSPAAGQETAGAKWQAVKTDTAYVDFAKLFDTYGKPVDKTAYAQAYIYSPAGGDFIIRVMHTSALNLWLNGKPTHKFTETELNYTPQMVKFNKGWNRLLVRSTPMRGAPNERPLPGTWYVNLVVEANPAGAQYDQKGIAWRTALPAPTSFGGPIFVDGKIFLLSDPADLVCLDAATGRILWVRSNNYNDAATDAEKKANPDIFNQIEPLAARLKEVNDSFVAGNPPKPEPVEGREEFKEKTGLESKLYALMKKVDDRKYALPKGQDVGYSGMTPVSDGKHVWGWCATGVTFCYDLDGKLIWRRVDNEGSFFEHGYSTSPVLGDGKIVVFMNKMIAFDASKGERLWTTEFDPKAQFANRFHGTPAVAKIGQTPVCVLPTGFILRLSDGKIIYDKGPGVSFMQQEIPSPVVTGNTVWRLSTYNSFLKVVLPAAVTEPLKMDSVRELKLDLEHYPTNYLPWHMPSPLVHEGLAYLVNNTGVLSVVDTETMKLVYERLLDLGHFQTAHEGPGRGVCVSPSLAGGRIYLVGTDGTTLVIKPGRTYEQLARNRIECVFWRYWGTRHERFVANPTFDGKRLFLRGERFMYCMEEGK